MHIHQSPVFVPHLIILTITTLPLPRLFLIDPFPVLFSWHKLSSTVAFHFGYNSTKCAIHCKCNITSISIYQSMASLMLNGAHQNPNLISGIAPNGLNFHSKCLFQKGVLSHGNKLRVVRKNFTPKGSMSASSSSSSRPGSQPRFIQHKKEAFWFYRFLSIVYDHP